MYHSFTNPPPPAAPRPSSINQALEGVFAYFQSLFNPYFDAVRQWIVGTNKIVIVMPREATAIVVIESNLFYVSSRVETGDTITITIERVPQPLVIDVQPPVASGVGQIGENELPPEGFILAPSGYAAYFCLWRGHILSESSNFHYAKFGGFSQIDGSEIWVMERTDPPDNGMAIGDDTALLIMKSYRAAWLERVVPIGPIGPGDISVEIPEHHQQHE